MEMVVSIAVHISFSTRNKFKSLYRSKCVHAESNNCDRELFKEFIASAVLLIFNYRNFLEVFEHARVDSK